MDRNRQARRLKPEDVDLAIDPSGLDFKTTEDLDPLDEVVGQPRALRALDLGLGVRHATYNVYVAGLNGTGKKETIRRELSKRSRQEERPPDWVYVNNFDEPDRPLAISLPAGQGIRLKHDVEKLLERLTEELPKAFREEDFSREKQRISQSYQERRRSMAEELENLANEKGLTVQMMPNGQMALIPKKDDRPMKPEEIEELSEEEQKDIQRRQQEVAQQADVFQSRHEEMGRQLSSEVRGVERNFAAERIEPLIGELAERYDEDKLQKWLDKMKGHMLDHLDRFREGDGTPHQQMAAMFGAPKPGREERLRDYQVNLLVDNADTEGAPVVIEDSPNYKNLFGNIERAVDRFGKLVTNFTRIKAGSLVRANGGYVVFNLFEALTEPLVWKELKRCIKSGRVKIETYDPFSIFSTSAMKPEPIPLDVKLVVLGNPLLYHLLYFYDEDFAEIFKIKAEFVSEMERQNGSARMLGQFARKLADQENLIPFEAEGVAELARTSARMAGDKEKLTTEFSRLADLVRESVFWARQDGADKVGRSHVQQAVSERIYRSDWIAAKIRELIDDGTLRIDLKGKAAGQLNGLALADLGDFAFARPSRVTASVGVGAAGVINIERESKLSGRTYDKGMLIIDGYMRNTYAGDHPLALSASLALEQSYGMIDGDSASLAEIVCLLSALADVPLRQDISVTGSVNQWGQVQAIGGVNEKIEGFFDVCREQGLTGDQGVCVPAANVKHLVLRPDVVDAIREEKFHVWAVDHVDEALELLGSIEAGSLDEEDTFHWKVDQQLRRLANAIKEHKATSVEREWPSLETVPSGQRDPRPTLPGRD